MKGYSTENSEEPGATQKEFAKRLGVSARTLKNWEHNRNKPAKSLWPQIHQFLGGA
jgi:DNA-binding XRE family transcriptional regulator